MIHNQSKKEYFVTIISWLELVANLNIDFLIGRYNNTNMHVIPRKLFQKMLRYIWWLYFEKRKVIVANYHTFSVEGEKVFLLHVSWIFCWLKTYAYMTVKIWKSYNYVSKSWRKEYGSDPRSYEHYLSGSEWKACKQFRPVRDLITYDLCDTIERWTGMAEVMGSNSVRAWIFFSAYFHYHLSSVRNCEYHFHLTYTNS